MQTLPAVLRRGQPGLNAFRGEAIESRICDSTSTMICTVALAQTEGEQTCGALTASAFTRLRRAAQAPFDPFFEGRS
jgi:hypothetical protein